jgi:hypothetical protein
VEEKLMRLRFAASLLLLAVIFVVPNVSATSVVRSGSPYGNVNKTESVPNIGVEYLVPLTPIDPSDNDLLLQINSTSPYLGDPLQVTLALAGTPFVGTSNFGLLVCDSSNGGNLIGAGVCPTSTSNSGCDLSGATISGSSITLPGSCNVAGATFYFDEAPSSSPEGVFASVSPTTAAVPEPSSLALLLVSLVPLALLSRRLLHP